MTQKKWERQLIDLYLELPNLIRSMQMVVEGASSGSFWKSNQSDSLLSVCENLIELNHQKNKLISLYRIFSECYQEIPQNLRQLLELRYRKNRSAASISAENNISVRSVYRALDRGAYIFADTLTRQGCDQTWLLKYFSDHLKKRSG